MEAKVIMRSEILDEKTCPICRNELDGITLPADDPRWDIYGKKAHPHCRYVLVPIFEAIDPVLVTTPDSELPRFITHFWGLSLADEELIEIAEAIYMGAENLLRGEKITPEMIEDIVDPIDLLRLIFPWRYGE